MKTAALVPCLAFWLLSAPLQASETESYFLPQSGLVILPHLAVGNDIYYAELNRASPSSLQFNLDTASLRKITPGPSDAWAPKAALVGNWKNADLLTETLSMGADGTLSVFSPSTGGSCPAGDETGTWHYNPVTGVLVTIVLTDTNGKCGISASGFKRVSVEGTTLVVRGFETDGELIEMRFIPQ